MSEKSEAAAALGRSKSKAKAAAARRNGALGGRPRKKEITATERARSLGGFVKGNSQDRRTKRRITELQNGARQ